MKKDCIIIVSSGTFRCGVLLEISARWSLPAHWLFWGPHCFCSLYVDAVQWVGKGSERSEIGSVWRNEAGGRKKRATTISEVSANFKFAGFLPQSRIRSLPDHTAQRASGLRTALHCQEAQSTSSHSTSFLYYLSNPQNSYFTFKCPILDLFIHYTHNGGLRKLFFLFFQVKWK